MIEKNFDTFYGRYADAVFLIRKSDFVIVKANQATIDLYEVGDPQNVLGRPFTEFKTSKLSQLTAVELTAIFAEIEHKGNCVLTVETKSLKGNKFIGEISITIISDEVGEYLLVTSRKVDKKDSKIEEINEAERNFRSVINQLPNGIVIHYNGKISYVNPYFLNILQLKEKEVIGKFICDLADENYQKMVQNHVESFERGEEPEIEHVKFNSKDGESISFSIQTVGDTFEGKKASISILTNLEIHKNFARQNIRMKLAEEANVELEKEILEHKKTQHKLQKQEEFNDSVINSSLDMIIASNAADVITNVSPSACFIFEYSQEEFIGLSPIQLYGDEDEYYRVKKQIEEEGFFIGEISNRKKSGELFTSYLSASPIKNPDGELLGYMGVSRDISEIKKAELEIINSEKRYRELFENLTDAIIIVDSKNNLLEMNEAAESLLEVKHGMGVTYNLYNFIAEESLVYAKKRARELIQKGVVKGVELEVITGKENRKTVELSSKAFYNDGKFEGSRDIIRDVTEKKKAENKLLTSLQEKEVLLKEVHHRVKNNLQVISSILNLQSSYVKDKKTLNILRESQNRIKSMSFIHESLYRARDFSSLNFSEYIENLVRNLVQSYMLDHDNVNTELDLGQHALSLDQAIPCGLIINELVSNSIKYAFPKGKEGMITVKLKEVENKLHFTVADNGIGLPENFNVEETDTLGLQLVYTLIDQLDGDIEVINDNGTKFLFNFTKLI